MKSLLEDELAGIDPEKVYEGPACDYGHSGLRWKSDNNCVGCKRIKCRRRSRERQQDPKYRAKRNAKGRQRFKERYANEPEYRAKFREQRLKRKYGITQQQYDEMQLRQGGGCAACGAARTELVVDHCHHTGKIRGLLCQPCNRGLGHLDDSPERLKALLRYLDVE